MHTHQFFTWTTHTTETTTLLEATRLQEALHLYVQHYNRTSTTRASKQRYKNLEHC